MVYMDEPRQTETPPHAGKRKRNEIVQAILMGAVLLAAVTFGLMAGKIAGPSAKACALGCSARSAAFCPVTNNK